jgi:predicted transcriptional regulator of viral defense system
VSQSSSQRIGQRGSPKEPLLAPCHLKRYFTRVSTSPAAPARRPRNATAYLDELQADGRLSFTTDEAIQALGRAPAAVRAQLRRLRSKGHIAEPHRGFHVVVPPSYRRLGCLPPEQFVPALLQHLGEPYYYVALLSAAAYHGAGHQAPMAFQVMVPRARRNLVCGGARVDFVARHDVLATSVRLRHVPTGTLRVASPAATALELVGYPERSGYLDQVATVLAELCETVDGPSLETEARRAPVAWVQRLGYLLELVDQPCLASRLEAVLAERQVFPVALAPWQPAEGAPRHARWKVAVNVTVEPEA